MLPLLAAAGAFSAPAIARDYAQLSTGLSMEWLRARPSRPAAAPPVLFVHGTFHSAWCWSERWMARFAAAGLECHAVSLRGTSASPDAASRSVKISQHVDDLRSFVDVALPSRPPPILVGHSFGGAYCMKYLEAGGPASGVALLCSVPPSGNGPMTARFLRRSLKQAFLITRGFAMKTARRAPSAPTRPTSARPPPRAAPRGQRPPSWRLDLVAPGLLSRGPVAPRLPLAGGALR